MLGTDRAGLYARSEGLDTREARMFGRAICQRCAGTPVQHLTGDQPFRRITLEVRPGVFVPRPETELLVEHVLAEVGDREDPVVVDAGTGTGAIALAVKDERPGRDGVRDRPVRRGRRARRRERPTVSGSP